jgi:hypothetical protein
VGFCESGIVTYEEQVRIERDTRDGGDAVLDPWIYRGRRDEPFNGSGNHK